MSDRALGWSWCLVALVLAVAVAGCQSCQGPQQAPPARDAQPQAEEPPAEAPHDHEHGADGEHVHDDEPAEAGEDEVDEDALVLLAEGDPEDGEAPLRVHFTVESLLEDEMKDPQYKWDFGDGTPISTEANPVHVYEKPGSYTATIRIVDAHGQLGWDEVDIEVEEP